MGSAHPQMPIFCLRVFIRLVRRARGALQDQRAAADRPFREPTTGKPRASRGAQKKADYPRRRRPDCGHMSRAATTGRAALSGNRDVRRVRRRGCLRERRASRTTPHDSFGRSPIQRRLLIPVQSPELRRSITAAWRSPTTSTWTTTVAGCWRRAWRSSVGASARSVCCFVYVVPSPGVTEDRTDLVFRDCNRNNKNGDGGSEIEVTTVQDCPCRRGNGRGAPGGRRDVWMSREPEQRARHRRTRKKNTPKFTPPRASPGMDG